MRIPAYARLLGVLIVVLFGVGAGAFLLSRDGERSGVPERVAPDHEPPTRSLPDHTTPTHAPEPRPDHDADGTPISAQPEFTGPRLYLVLDDAGQSLDEFARFSAFEEVATIAVLPHAPAGRAVTEAARAAGHDVILHQPMEAINGENPGPGALFTHHGEVEIREILEDNLRRYPEVVGVNNHMGSRVTADERIMETVLQVLREEILFFLDSRTTHLSVVPKVAGRLGISVLSRNVFLDHNRSREEILSQLDHALEIAREQGFVIMIGHITVPETVAVLLERQREIVAAGYHFFPLAHAYENGDIHRYEKGQHDADVGH